MDDRLQTFIAPTHSGFHQMIRFGIAGAAATVADVAVFIFLMHLWDTPVINISGYSVKSYLVYQSISFTLGLIVSYVFSIKWVFPHRAIKSRRLEFIVFFAIGVGGLMLTNWIMYTGLEILGVKEVFTSGLPEQFSVLGYHTTSDKFAVLFMKAVAIVLVFFYNFGVRKMTMFKKPAKQAVRSV